MYSLFQHTFLGFLVEKAVVYQICLSGLCLERLALMVGPENLEILHLVSVKERMDLKCVI